MVVYKENLTALIHLKMPYFRSVIVLGQQATPNVWPNE